MFSPDKNVNGKDSPTSEGLAALGLENLAYIRPLRINGRNVQVIHAADGTPLSLAPNRALAFVVVRQYEMEPLSVH